MGFKGTMKNGAVAFDEPHDYPNGTRVSVRPVRIMASSPGLGPDSTVGRSEAVLTDEQWFRTCDPDALLLVVHSRMGVRKARLFATACCWRIVHRLPAEIRTEMIAASEAFADGNFPQDKFDRMSEALSKQRLQAGARRALGRASEADPDQHVVEAIETLLYRSPAPDIVAIHAARSLASEYEVIERAFQAQLLRCILPPPSSSLSLKDIRITSTAVAIAQDMYDSRDFSAMPILADALQDAGCEHADILDHCRGPGPHVKGCWVVDLVLGKE